MVIKWRFWAIYGPIILPNIKDELLKPAVRIFHGSMLRSLIVLLSCIVLLYCIVLLSCIVLLYCIIVLYYCIVLLSCIVLLYCIIVLYYCIVLLYCIIVLYYCFVLYHCILVLYWVALDPNLIVIFIIAAVGLWVVTTSTMTRAPAPPSSQAVLATITSHSMRYYRSSPNICLCTTVPSLLYATSITSRLLWIAKSWFLW